MDSTVVTTDEDFLHEAADRLRLRLSRTAEDIIEIGRELIAVKDRVGHGNFLPWIDREFSMTEKSAERFMSVAKRFGGKSDTVSKLPATVLYELAAPNTTEGVRTEIVDRAESGERISVADIRALKGRAYVARHGTPELIAAVDRGEIPVSEAVAFVRNYPPSAQDGWIMKGGTVAEAVTQANAAKAPKAGQTVAQETPGLFADVKDKVAKPISGPSDDQRKGMLRLAAVNDNVVTFVPKADDDDDAAPGIDPDVMTFRDNDPDNNIDITDHAFGAHAIYGSLSTIDLAQTTPETFWATFGTPNGKAGTAKWLDSSIKKLTEIKKGMPK
jgi:hypothetical protein